MTTSAPPPDDERRQALLDELRAEEELLRRLEYDASSQFAPNDTQWNFLNHDPSIKEMMMSGMNQSGKTTAIRYGAGVHIEGKYPENWTGPRFDHPIECVLAGETAETIRDLLVNFLLGPPEARGSGFISETSFDPKTDIKRAGGGVADAVSYFRVKHFTDGVFDGYSHVYCMQYSKGWRKAQGYTLDLVVIDEEPPFDVYDELTTRTNKTGGHTYITMTPLEGETDLFLMFERDTTGLRDLIFYDVEKATHLTEEEKARLYLKYENHPMREARLFGRPVRGKGLVFTTPEDRWVVDDCVKDLSPYWGRIVGIDLPHGVGTFAGGKLVYDEQSDIVYMVGEYKAQGEPWPVYESRLRGMGCERVPIGWPHDGNVRGTDGRTGYERLEAAGLNVCPEPAHYLTHDGKKTNAVWTAIEELIDRMQTGRFRCFRSCTEFRDEVRKFKHDSQKILPKQEDHLIDAVLKGLMMLRYAEPVDGSSFGDSAVASWEQEWQSFDFFA